jgi:hypothetical protein
MASLLSLAKSDIAKVLERRKDIKKARELECRNFEEMLTQPLPVEESCARLMKILDRRGAEFYELWLKRRLAGLATECAKINDSQGLQASMILFQNAGQLSPQELEGFFAFFFRDVVQSGLLRSLKNLNMKCGASAADRVQKLVDLEAKVKQLEQDEKAIDAELDALRSELAQ